MNSFTRRVKEATMRTKWNDDMMTVTVKECINWKCERMKRVKLNWTIQLPVNTTTQTSTQSSLFLKCLVSFVNSRKMMFIRSQDVQVKLFSRLFAIVTNGLYHAWSLVSLVVIIMIIVAVTINTEAKQSNIEHEERRRRRKKSEWIETIAEWK